VAFSRQVVTVPGQDRVNSRVPEGLRVGDWLFCSLLGPTYTNRPPVKGAEAEAQVLFERIGDLVKAAGGGPENVVQLGVYVLDDAHREDINREWVKMFPDPAQRPARYILNVDPDGTHWDFAAHFTAILGDNLGRIVYSPMITARNGGKDLPPDRLDEAAAMLDNLKAWIEEKGGTLENVASVMVYLMQDDRNTLNKAWDKVFPDIENLPARQTLVVWPDGIPDANLGAFATAVL
jgi:2-iminobutanoate/2-iminopropanoate deaminase